MRKFEVIYTDPFQDENSITVFASNKADAVYIAEKQVDMCDVLEVSEVVE